ncbi:MAG: hypothetical protein EOO50_13370 [Flavobacterium sp.]|uniref:hypothetical protein n=1 Tax=Flavobacterium sp. TaxID=239 RepID=UPI0012243045|nr:hypothetical protein [Flavobacterium sp.]RZJ65531.1 MAG: hypothetical protein EOO50_13370 [Flavobacterium sp.]
MTRDEFLSRFFDRYPIMRFSIYDVICLESCVAGTKHSYRFKDNRLTSIHFSIDTYWKVDF